MTDFSEANHSFRSCEMHESTFNVCSYDLFSGIPEPCQFIMDVSVMDKLLLETHINIE